MAWARRITPLGPSRYETLGNSTVSFMISSSEFRDDLLGQQADRVDDPVVRDLSAGVHVQRDARDAQRLAIFHDALRHRAGADQRRGEHRALRSEVRFAE